MIVAGVMSGTSADGIDVALVDISSSLEGQNSPRCKLLGHAEHPYPAAVRRAILASMNAKSATVADLARLNFLLGELYAEAVIAAQRKFKRTAELIGCHGQTLYHQGHSERFLGRRLSVTWQTGEGAILAARTGIPVVSDYRPADMAAGGKGAPLVPFLDYALYADKNVGRIVQNIGGIANLTAIPAGASPSDVIAFDTGPGNMVIDALMEHFFKRHFDRDGRTAAKGKVLQAVLAEVLRASFFARNPPKTAGREEFGREFVAHVLRRCRGARMADIVATATALTARSIGLGIRRYVLRRGMPMAGETPALRFEVIMSGGGTKNRTLMRMLEAELSPLHLRLRTSDEFGIPVEAKEAVAFALLAFQTWHHRPSNVPSATGAKRPAILGKISYV
ncbi:MAG TPA: anhydro-N-acetylmuramic acid kinase [Terriglobales bacterium]|nr:anhydro-N-acetylmuramic acid kinase [Terriglobales bacterium]